MATEAASAGRKASRASSASVMSRAVPNVAMVVIRLMVPRRLSITSGVATSLGPSSGRRSGSTPDRAHQALQLGLEGHQLLVAGDQGLAPDPAQDVVGPRRQVQDAGRQAVGVQGDAQHVDRRRQQFVADPLHQHRRGRVGQHQLPLAVHDHRRIGLVPGQHLLEGLAHRLEAGVGQLALTEGGSEAGGDEELVAVAQGHVELLGQVQHHLAAGAGPSRLDEAQVAGGHPGGGGQLELAEVTALAPRPQQGPHRWRRTERAHRVTVPTGPTPDDSLPGNRRRRAARVTMGP